MKADVNPHLAFELRPETEHLRVALAAALAEALVADFRRNPPPLTSLRSSPEGEPTDPAPTHDVATLHPEGFEGGAEAGAVRRATPLRGPTGGPGPVSARDFFRETGV